MQQRRSALSGRPTGTDGSDFNYRMVVDSRYQKVADGKSRLYALIIIQAVLQLIGVLYIYLFTSQEEYLNVIAISSMVIGFISLILGDIGRRRSRVTLLKVHMVASTIALLLSIFCVAKVKIMLEVFQTPSRWEIHKFELLEAAHAAVGFLVQILTVPGSNPSAEPNFEDVILKWGKSGHIVRGCFNHATFKGFQFYNAPMQRLDFYVGEFLLIYTFPATFHTVYMKLLNDFVALGFSASANEYKVPEG